MWLGDPVLSLCDKQATGEFMSRVDRLVSSSACCKQAWQSSLHALRAPRNMNLAFTSSRAAASCSVAIQKAFAFVIRKTSTKTKNLDRRVAKRCSSRRRKTDTMQLHNTSLR